MGVGWEMGGVTYVLQSPLQNGVYLCIQGLDSLLAWRIWKQQFTAQLSNSNVKSSSSKHHTSSTEAFHHFNQIWPRKRKKIKKAYLSGCSINTRNLAKNTTVFFIISILWWLIVWLLKEALQTETRWKHMWGEFTGSHSLWKTKHSSSTIVCTSRLFLRKAITWQNMDSISLICEVFLHYIDLTRGSSNYNTISAQRTVHMVVSQDNHRNVKCMFAAVPLSATGWSCRTWSNINHNVSLVPV